MHLQWNDYVVIDSKFPRLKSICYNYSPCLFQLMCSRNNQKDGKSKKHIIVLNYSMKMSFPQDHSFPTASMLSYQESHTINIFAYQLHAMLCMVQSADLRLKMVWYQQLIIILSVFPGFHSKTSCLWGSYFERHRYWRKLKNLMKKINAD